MHECEVCHAKVAELRRGRCWGCYGHWVDARPVGANARCITCSERRRRVLKSVEVFGGWMPMCFNCAGQMQHLSPMPQNLIALKNAISRERRARDRRYGKLDTRVFRTERRVGERRELREDCPAIEDDMIVEVSVAADGGDFEDMTRIHELLPAALR